MSFAFPPQRGEGASSGTSAIELPRDALALHKEGSVELLSALFYGVMERIFVPRHTRERWAREESLMFENAHRFIAHVEARQAATLDRWHEEDTQKGGTYLAHYTRALGAAQR